MLDRERAEFSPHPRLAQGSLRPPRRGHRDPDRLGARAAGRDRPDRHEGLSLRRRGPRHLGGDRDPRRPARPSGGVPREADGRGRRGVRRADGALSRRGGDLARGDRVGAQVRRHERHDLPRHVRRRHARNLGTNRLLDALVEDLPSPAKKGPVQAGEETLEPVDDADLVAFVFKTLADPFAGRINLFRVVPGRDQARLPRLQLPRALQGAHRPAARAPGQGARARG